MKITKIPNFGDYGIYIDGLDLASMDTQELKDLKNELYTKYLLVIFRDTNLPLAKFSSFIKTIGTSSFGMRAFARSLGMSKNELFQAMVSDTLSEEHKEVVHSFKSQLSEYSSDGISIVKLAGKSEDSEKQFLDGDINWHTDESMDISFCDSIALFGEKNMQGSATCFMTTAKWYEELTESTRSEMQDMICIHEFKPYEFNSNMTPVEELVIRNTTGFSDRLPLVVNTRGGIQGLHVPYNTMIGIDGMSDTDFKNFKEYIKKSLFKEEYMCEHWYKHDNDLILFDNAVSIHRRIGSTAGRVAYRAPFYFNDPVADRYLQPEFQKLHIVDMERY